MAATRSALRRLAPAHGFARPCTPAVQALPLPLPPHLRRSLFNLAAAALGHAPAGPQQSLTTARTLPYAAADLFRIVADINAYAQFLPHCTASRVTHWRAPTSSSESWPARADLTVGWGPLSQTYSSRVYCVPGHGVVEAVSGRAGAPTLTAAERAEIGLNQSEDADGRRLGAATATDDETFESLVTRWKVQPLPAPAAAATPAPAAAPGSVKTRVELHIQFQFRNPLYQIAAARVGDEMATKMIEAFENRAADLLGPKSRQL